MGVRTQAISFLIRRLHERAALALLYRGEVAVVNIDVATVRCRDSFQYARPELGISAAFCRDQVSIFQQALRRTQATFAQRLTVHRKSRWGSLKPRRKCAEARHSWSALEDRRSLEVCHRSRGRGFSGEVAPKKGGNPGEVLFLRNRPVHNLRGTAVDPVEVKPIFLPAA